MSSTRETILSVSNLSIGFDTDDGLIPVIEDVSFSLHQGGTLALVGESGCGKSVTAFALLKLLPPFGRIISGSIKFRGKELVNLTESEIQSIRGDRISMIFQEPMSALNPVFTVGSQVAESLILHRAMDKQSAWEQAIEMLSAVGIADAAQRAKSYPHQLSGGLRQRIMIAMALSCAPDILVADEPTTALDVTIQAQILDLMHDLQERFGTAILFISHDFGVVSRMADDIAVMYAGKIVETGSAREVLTESKHPYTRALLETTPRIDASLTRLPAIGGRVPAPGQRPAGCYFNPRCPNASDHCGEQIPPLVALSATHQLTCHEVVSG
jgi:oligopeptide/dipeptide ABC transporter ATP-binding protein